MVESASYPVSDLSASLEDYLEAIFHIVETKGAARPKDIAGRLGVNNSSVTAALKALAARELVNYAPYDVVTLTAAGEAHAADVIRRHEALKSFFVKVLSVDEPIADEGACKMEHAVPRTIVDRFIQFVEFVEICPRAGGRFVEGFGYHCRSGCSLEDCDRCLALSLDDVQERRAELAGGARSRHTLDTVEPGQRARVIGIAGDEATSRRLTDQGITTGSLVEVEQVTAHGGPLAIKVKGYHLSLSRREAGFVEVEDFG